MALKFTHARLLVSNYEACFLFYRDLLGFDVAWGNENEDYAEFRTGEIKLALFNRQLMAKAIGSADKPSFVESQDSIALIFAVDDVNKVYQRLTSQGVIFINEPLDRPEWGIRTTHFRDPDGNLIEINSNLNSSADESPL